MQEAFDVLADPQRRRIVDLLRASPRTAGELGAKLELSQPGTSRHLRILREAGFVESRPRAQQRIYSLKPERFDELADWLSGIRALWSGQLDALGEFLETTAGPAATETKAKGR